MSERLIDVDRRWRSPSFRAPMIALIPGVRRHEDRLGGRVGDDVEAVLHRCRRRDSPGATSRRPCRAIHRSASTLGKSKPCSTSQHCVCRCTVAPAVDGRCVMKKTSQLWASVSAWMRLTEPLPSGLSVVQKSGVLRISSQIAIAAAARLATADVRDAPLPLRADRALAGALTEQTRLDVLKRRPRSRRGRHPDRSQSSGT